MSDYKYVREHYGVPAETGRVVKVEGKRGVIIKDCGHYIGVNFDDDRPGEVSQCHPTCEVEYLGIENKANICEKCGKITLKYCWTDDKRKVCESCETEIKKIDRIKAHLELSGKTGISI